jgi:hypothetical protein
MGAFKQFNTNEVTITPFKPEKNFSFTGDEILSASIDIFSGVNTSSLSTNLTSGLLTSYPQASIYGGIRQLYYSNYYSSSKGDPIPTQRVIPGVTPQDDYFYGQVTAPRYENYLQTDILQDRFLNPSPLNPITVISIPQNLYGEYIKPSSFSLLITTETPNSQYVDYTTPILIETTNPCTTAYSWYSEYGTTVYIEDQKIVVDGAATLVNSSYTFPTISGSSYTMNYNINSKSGSWIGRIRTCTSPSFTLPAAMPLNIGDNTHTFVASSSLSHMYLQSNGPDSYIKFNNILIESENVPPNLITDDGEGNLTDNTNPNSPPGHIFYPQGMVILNKGFYNDLGQTVNNTSSLIDDIVISFTSALTIHENQYKCTIRADEFNYSMNPTLLTGSQDNNYYSFVTGSTFTPYITTVGLYNNTHDLIAVGKLSQPIPKSNYIDTTIIVNFDTI